MTSSRAMLRVDHRSVVSAWNWAKATAALARGEGVEQRGRWDGPYGHRSDRRRPQLRRQAAVHGEGSGQRGRRREEGRASTVSSPGARWCGRGRPGRTDGDAAVLDGRRTERMKTGQWRRSRAPRDDSVGVEVEEVTAGLPTRSARLRAASNAGDVKGGGGGHGGSEARVRVSSGEEQRAGETRRAGHGAMPSLSTRGGARVEGQVRDTAAMAPVSPLSPTGKGRRRGG